MAVGIFAAALGLLIGAACIVIPRVVGRRNNPYDETDAVAYEQETGRSAKEIEQENVAGNLPQEGTSKGTGPDAQ